MDAVHVPGLHVPAVGPGHRPAPVAVVDAVRARLRRLLRAAPERIAGPGELHHLSPNLT